MRTTADQGEGGAPGPSPESLAQAFALALAEAEAHVGATAPNPAVGCVILDTVGNVLARAAHERAGEPHAEALALRRLRTAGALERAHTAVVTLEPCSHQGRTPPCSRALIDTPLKSFWLGAPDPHPRAPGRGRAELIRAGRSVASFAELEHPAAAALHARAERLIRPFAVSSTSGRPYVRIKTALQADGSMTPPRGAKTFTSAESLTFAHVLRREADAVLTGSGTVLADRPEFTVRRVPDHPGRRRILAVLDRRGRVDESYYRAAQGRGFLPQRYLDLEEALTDLRARGVLSVLVEAGPTLRAAVLEAGLWDEDVVFQKNPDPRGPDLVRILQRSEDEASGPPRAPAFAKDL